MLRALAKWYARRSYIWTLEVEAGKGDVNAAIAQRNADEARKIAEQLNAEADAIDKNIEAEQTKLEKGYWECGKGHEMDLQPPTKPSDEKFNGIPVAKPTCPCGSPAKLVELDLMSGQEKYELEKQKKDAQSIAAEKRGLAEQQRKSVSEKEQTAQSLRGLAANSRMFADKIREL